MTNQTNETQKRTRGEIEHGRLRTEIEVPKLPERGKSMNEETKPEAKDQPQTKDKQETPKPELLVLKTGYGQHANLNLPHTALNSQNTTFSFLKTTKNPKILNVLIQNARARANTPPQRTKRSRSSVQFWI